MDHHKVYLRLIEEYSARTLVGYTEKHHIIPKCLGGTNDPSNLVVLTAKAHYVAHHLLCLMHPNISKLRYAFWRMASGRPNQGRHFTSRMYEVAKKMSPGFQAYNERKKIEGFTPEEIEKKRKAGLHRKGKVMSNEGRASYSSAAQKRDRTAPMVTCSKCNHTQKRSVNFYRYHEKNCRYCH